MAHSKNFKQIKMWYARKMWTIEQCRNAVEKGMITTKEFTEITKEAYA